MSSVTPFQPSLPAEGVFTDAELAFIDESPPGLFPENQNSNFGFIIRKLFTDKLQDLIGQQQTLYNERFVNTALDYLDVWEADYGLPVAVAGRSVAQRRQDVLGRIRVGPYTRARRAEVVENFLIPLLGGTAVALTPEGVSIGAGVPLYGGLSSLLGVYAIRENYTWRNQLTNPSFETNTTGWTTWNLGTGAITVTRDTAQSKYGAASGRIDTTGINQMCGTAQGTYTPPIGTKVAWSFWVKGGASAIGKLGSCYLSQGGPNDVSVPFVIPSDWQRVHLLTTTVNSSIAPYVMVSDPNISLWIDGAQLEYSDRVNDYSDPSDPDYWYQVRILNSVSPDIVGLTRELNRITPAGISFSVVQVASP